MDEKKKPTDHEQQHSKPKEQHEETYRESNNPDSEINYIDAGRYLRDRLESQLEWFDKRSSKNQRQYKKLKRLEIIISAFIPVIISFSTMGIIQHTTVIWPQLTLDILFQIVAAVAGVFLVILAGFSELESHFNKWKDYRITAEELRQERIKYLTRSEPYDGPNPFHQLVENVENILNKENQNWRSIIARQKVNQQGYAAHQQMQAGQLNQTQTIRQDKTAQYQAPVYTNTTVVDNPPPPLEETHENEAPQENEPQNDRVQNHPPKPHNEAPPGNDEVPPDNEEGFDFEDNDNTAAG